MFAVRSYDKRGHGEDVTHVDARTALRTARALAKQGWCAVSIVYIDGVPKVFYRGANYDECAGKFPFLHTVMFAAAGSKK